MMRLDKFLALSGSGTRSEVKKQIKKKQISVNGETVENPDYKIDPDRDLVFFNGKEIKYEQYAYFVFYKPSGCVTARQDSKDKTVMDYFPENMRRNFSPVGRLDKDTEGLLLITNDGALNHTLTSPAYHVEKTYYAQLDVVVPEEAVDAFKKGVDIGDKKITMPAKLRILPTVKKNGSNVYAAELTICEGRFHQVKRMFHAVGCEVVYLKRLSMGGLSLENLSCGHYRKLLPEEVFQLTKIYEDGE